MLNIECPVPLSPSSFSEQAMMVTSRNGAIIFWSLMILIFLALLEGTWDVVHILWLVIIIIWRRHVF